MIMKFFLLIFDIGPHAQECMVLGGFLFLFFPLLLYINCVFVKLAVVPELLILNSKLNTDAKIDRF